MAKRYIDFISAYCDSRCERCAFTERCSHFAVKSALAMCDGDMRAALELAVGPARKVGGPPQKSLSERMAEQIGDYEQKIIYLLFICLYIPPGFLCGRMSLGFRYSSNLLLTYGTWHAFFEDAPKF